VEGKRAQEGAEISLSRASRERRSFFLSEQTAGRPPVLARVMAAFARLEVAFEPSAASSPIALRRGSTSPAPGERKKRGRRPTGCFPRARAVKPEHGEGGDGRRQKRLKLLFFSFFDHDKPSSSRPSPVPLCALPLTNHQVVHADNTGRLRTPFECVQREVRGLDSGAFCFLFSFFLRWRCREEREKRKPSLSNYLIGRSRPFLPCKRPSTALQP
jgi:hypothetical protein